MLLILNFNNVKVLTHVSTTCCVSGLESEKLPQAAKFSKRLKDYAEAWGIHSEHLQ